MVWCTCKSKIVAPGPGDKQGAKARSVGKNAAACALSPESKLAVTLRWLGGASAWELTQIYWPSRTDGVDHSSFYYIVRQVMRSIIKRQHG